MHNVQIWCQYGVHEVHDVVTSVLPSLEPVAKSDLRSRNWLAAMNKKWGKGPHQKQPHDL